MSDRHDAEYNNRFDSRNGTAGYDHRDRDNYSRRNRDYEQRDRDYDRRSRGYDRRDRDHDLRDRDNRDPNVRRNHLSFLHADPGSMSAIKIICLIILAVLVVMFVVKIGMIVVTGFGPFIESAKAVIDAIFNRLVSGLVSAVVIYILL